MDKIEEKKVEKKGTNHSAEKCATTGAEALHYCTVLSSRSLNETSWPYHYEYLPLSLFHMFTAL